MVLRKSSLGYIGAQHYFSSIVEQKKSGAHPKLTRATPTELLTAHKPHAGELVVGWVTTSESSLLYVFVFFIRSETSFCRPTLQPIQPIHLNFLHASEPLTCPSPPVLAFSQACCFDDNFLVLVSTG
ncbi:hypothetical protein VN97_g10197 [Penicillium thymicola]|uniref:Uncharacterized protein n=1 Tax=Penicillium thymicola TaxID=293382 RepID=A0AAI9TAX6_PENTH|nr:hypothetical protein VN97_g10197 [Penicillium thymicola]